MQPTADKRVTNESGTFWYRIRFVFKMASWKARAGFPALIPREKIPIFWLYNKSFINLAFLVKMAGYGPRSFVRFYWPRLCLGPSPRTSPPGRSSGGLGKGGRACSYVSGIWLSASKKVDPKCWLTEMTLAMTSLPLAFGFVCFSMFVYIRARFRFALIGGNLTAQGREGGREPQANLRWNSNCRDVDASSSFCRPTARAPRRAYSLTGYLGPWTGKKKLGQYPAILLTSRLVNDAYVLLLVLFTRQRKLEQVDTYYDFHFICL